MLGGAMRYENEDRHRRLRSASCSTAARGEVAAADEAEAGAVDRGDSPSTGDALRGVEGAGVASQRFKDSPNTGDALRGVEGAGVASEDSPNTGDALRGVEGAGLASEDSPNTGDALRGVAGEVVAGEAAGVFISAAAAPYSRKMTARKRLMTKQPARITPSAK
eukprot:6361353-Prymnesium_polylepis.1